MNLVICHFYQKRQKTKQQQQQPKQKQQHRQKSANSRAYCAQITEMPRSSYFSSSEDPSSLMSVKSHSCVCVCAAIANLLTSEPS